MIQIFERVENIEVTNINLTANVDAVVQNTVQKKFFNDNDSSKYKILGTGIVLDANVTGIGMIRPLDYKKSVAIASTKIEFKILNFCKFGFIKDCIFESKFDKSSEFSDDILYQFKLSGQPDDITEKVQLIIQSEILPEEDYTKLNNLIEGDKVNLKIILPLPFSGIIMCFCILADNDELPIFKLDPEYSYESFGLSKFNKNAYYTVEKGKLVEAKNPKPEKIITFLKYKTLTLYIKQLIEMTK